MYFLKTVEDNRGKNPKLPVLHLKLTSKTLVYKSNKQDDLI